MLVCTNSFLADNHLQVSAFEGLEACAEFLLPGFNSVQSVRQVSIVLCTYCLHPLAFCRVCRSILWGRAYFGFKTLQSLKSPRHTRHTHTHTQSPKTENIAFSNLTQTGKCGRPKQLPSNSPPPIIVQNLRIHHAKAACSNNRRKQWKTQYASVLA